MDRIILPALYCPFPPAINKHAEEVRHQTLRWASEAQIITNDCLRRQIHAARLDRLMARAYPHAARPSLQAINDWTAVLFVWDHQCHEPWLSQQPGMLRARCDRLLEVLLDGHAAPYDDALLHAFADVSRRLHQQASRMWIRHFVHSVQEYLEGMIWEADHRAHGIAVDTTLYLNLRRFSGALEAYFDLIDLSEGISLPIEVRKHALVEQMSIAAGNVICWINDLFALQKELRHGDLHNLVIALQREHQSSLQTAIDRAAALHNAEVRRFIELEAQLPGFGPAANIALSRYVGVLRAWMRGNLDWAQETSLYRCEDAWDREEAA